MRLVVALLTAAISVAFFVLVAHGHSMETVLCAAGFSCPLYEPHPAEPDTTEGFVRKADLTCQAVNGTYMKAGVHVQLDSRTTAYGSCTNQAFDCTFIKLEQRDVNHNDTTRDFLVDGYGTQSSARYSPVWPVVGTGLHEFDSRAPDTTAAPTDTLSNVGTYTFNFQGVINLTNCYMYPHYTPLKSVTVNVVKCLPKFWIGNGYIERVPSGSVTVYIPPELQGTPLDLSAGHAKDAWNNRLANYGSPVTISLSYFPCSGAGCINVGVAPPPPNIPDACADIAAPPLEGRNPDGSWNVAVPIHVRDNWTQWSDSFRDWVLTHELGHAFGLSENTCPLADSLFGPFSACGQNMSNTAPTVSDGMAVKKTTYNPDGSTTVCP